MAQSVTMCDLLAEYPEILVKMGWANYNGKPLEMIASLKGPIEVMKAFNQRAEALGLITPGPECGGMDNG